MTDQEQRNRFHAVNDRLKKLEEKSDKQDEIILTMHDLTNSVNGLAKEVKQQGDEIQEMKQAPIERKRARRNTIITACITAVVGGVLGYLINAIIQLFS